MQFWYSAFEAAQHFMRGCVLWQKSNFFWKKVDVALQKCLNNLLKIFGFKCSKRFNLALVTIICPVLFYNYGLGCVIKLKRRPSVHTMMSKPSCFITHWNICQFFYEHYHWLQLNLAKWKWWITTYMHCCAQFISIQYSTVYLHISLAMGIKFAERLCDRHSCKQLWLHRPSGNFDLNLIMWVIKNLDKNGWHKWLFWTWRA